MPKPDKTYKNLPDFSASTDMLVLGKIPPQAVSAEEVVLGACLLENGLPRVSDVLLEQMFYKNSHQLLYKAMRELNGEGKPVDMVTVMEYLKSSGDLEDAGGAYYITQLTNRVASASNIEAHAKIVFEKYVLRELIRISTETIRTAYENADAFDLTAQVTSHISKIMGLLNVSDKTIRHIKEPILDLLNQIQLNSKSLNSMTGLNTGFVELNKHTGGLQKGDLIVIAGKTSHGKTALAMNFSINTALLDGATVLIFSLEMSDIQLVSRMLGNISHYNTKQLLVGQLDQNTIDGLTKSSLNLVGTKIYIDKSANTDLDYICNQTTLMKAKIGLDVVIIDYLQLMSSMERNGSDAAYFGGMAKRLKALARQLDIPVVLLSQVRRTQMNRPRLYDLKESGDIGDSADLVIFVYNPSLFGENSVAVNGNEFNSDGVILIDVAKGRSYGTTEFLLNFNKYHQRFENYEVQEFKTNEEVPY
jgi:replicative DNA helicase